MLAVSQLLQYFEPYGINLIAGQGGLSNQIEYTTVHETGEKSSRIKRNGYILTTFKEFDDSEQIIQQFYWYKLKNVSAVGFHLAVHFEIPEEVLNIADILEIPLFEIPKDLPYYVIFDKLNESKRRAVEYFREQVTETNEKILNILIEDGDSSKIIHLMGKFMNTAVVLLNQYNQIQSSWKGEKFSDNSLRSHINVIIKEGPLLSRIKQANEREYFEFDDSQVSFAIFPLIQKNYFFGFLLIALSVDDEEKYAEVINQGKTALLLNIKRMHTRNDMQKNQDIKLIETIIEGRKLDTKEEDFHFSVSSINRFVLVDVERSYLNKTYMLLEETLQQISNKYFLWVMKNKIVGLITEKDYSSLLKNIHILEFESACFSFSGYIDHFTPAKLKKAYEQACIVNHYSKNRNLKLIVWDKLGFERISTFLSKQYLFQDYTYSVLDPLLSYDKEHGTELVDTLYAYLQSFFSLKDSAKLLFVHPNTVKYRIQKIKQLMPNINLQDMNDFMDLMTALSTYFIYSENRQKD